MPYYYGNEYQPKKSRAASKILLRERRWMKRLIEMGKPSWMEQERIRKRNERR